MISDQVPEGVEWTGDGLKCSVSVEDALFPARMSVVGAIGALGTGLLASVALGEPAMALFLGPMTMAVGMFGGLRLGALWRTVGRLDLEVGGGAIAWRVSRFGAPADEQVVRAVDVQGLRLRGPRSMSVVLETRDGQTHSIPLGDWTKAAWLAERIAEHVRAHGGRAGTGEEVPDALQRGRLRLRDREGPQ